MRLVYLFLIVLLQGVSCDNNVVLTDMDSSFVIHGRDLVRQAFTISHKCDGCTIAVAAQLTNVKQTSLQIKDPTNTYNETEFYTAKILYLLSPASVSAAFNSDSFFALTFTLLAKGATMNSTGISTYSVVPLSGDANYKDFSYIFGDGSAEVTSVVAPATDNSRPFMMIKEFSVKPGCTVDVFSGGLQSMNGKERHRLTTLRPSGVLSPSIVQSTGLTYLIPNNCAINMTIVNLLANLDNISVAIGQIGFLMSSEYPGNFNFNQMPSKSFVTTLTVEGNLFANITFDIQSLDAGDEGILTFKSDVEKAVVLWNETQKSQSMIGKRFTITWSPGKNAHGFMMRYSVRYHRLEPTIRLIELSPLDTSFVIAGSRLVGKTLQLNQKDCSGCIIMVQAQINNLKSTSIVLSDGTSQFSANDIYQKNVFLTPPAAAMGLDNSTTDFIITFTLLKQGQTLKSLGYDQYELTTLSSGELTTNKDSNIENMTKINTMVATNNFTVAPYTQIRDFYVPPGCTVDLFVGGIPTMNGKERHRLVTLSSNTSLTHSTISSPALTYVIPPNCPYNFTVYNTNIPMTQTFISADQTGFVMSTGYPGTMGWRENGEGSNSSRILAVAGGNVVNTTFEIATVSDGGILTIESDVQPAVKFVSNGATMSLIGSYFKINWFPGTSSTTGYLVRYTVSASSTPPTSRLVVLSKQDSSFVVQGNRAVGKTFQISQTDCPGCTVRVIAQIYNENTTFIQLKDAQKTYSVSDISFGKSVSLSLPATVEVPSNSSNNFVLTFTLLQPGQSFRSFGVDYYVPLTLPYDGLYVIKEYSSDNSTATTMALTNTNMQPPGIQIIEFHLSTNCTVDVFTGGLQSIDGKDKHYLVTLSSSLSLAPSIVRSTAISYIIPPNCANNFSIGGRPDHSDEVSVSVGQTGFLMSSGYPGGIGFREANELYTETTTLKVAGGNSANFTMLVVSIDGGQLDIGKNNFNYGDNILLKLQGSEITIKWTPGFNPRGYLIRYSLSEDNSPKKDNDKSSSLRSILLSMTVVLMVWCL